MTSIPIPTIIFLVLIATCILAVDATPLNETAAGPSPQNGSSNTQQLPEVESSDEGVAFAATLVSGFYGPGAFVSWILVAISTILDKVFEPKSDGATEQQRDYSSEGLLDSSSKSKKPVYGQILGLDLNLISTLAYPCIATVNACLYFRKLQQEGAMEADDIAKLAAPLAVLRTWTNSLGAFVVAAWGAKLARGGPRSSGKMYVDFLPRKMLVRRDIIAVLIWILAISALKQFFLVTRHFAHMSAVEWEWVEMIARMNPESMSFEPLLYGFMVIGALAWFVVHVMEDGPSTKESRIFYLVLMVYLVSFVFGASFDIIYCRRLWQIEILEQSKPAIPDVGATGVFSTMSLRLSNQNKELHYFQQYFTNILDGRENFKFEHGAYPRVWGIAEDLILWPAGVLSISPMRLVFAAAKIQVVLGWIILGLFSVTAVVLVVGLVLSKLPFSFLSEDAVDAAETASSGAIALLTLFGPMSYICDVTILWTVLTTWLQILFPVFRPDLLVPVSSSGWTDLDQITALVLNGLVPLAFSAKFGLQMTRRTA